MDKLEAKLITAVRDANLEAIKSLLKQGANVNVVSTSGRTPLGIAATLGDVCIIQVLLGAGNESGNCSTSGNQNGQEEPVDDNQTNLGYFIMVHDDVTSVDAITQCEVMDMNLNEAETPEGMEGLEWDVEMTEGENEAEEDVWSNQYRWYANILSKTCCIVVDVPNYCDVNQQDMSGRCAIHYAADQGHYDAVKCLINSGCRVDVPDGDNVTPLHLAAARDHIGVAKLLLANGADINLKSADKMAALHFAAARGFTEMVRLLLDTGAHVDALDSSDRTALHLAVSRGHLDVVQILLEHGAKINIEEIHGYTPLCEAVWQKSVELAQLLLDAGAKLTQSHYLLHYAVLHQHLSMAKLLLSAGSIPNLRDDNGDTPLIIAARTHNVAMANLLLENGALPGYTNSLSGSTPLHESISNNHNDDRNTSLEAFVKVLIYHGVDLNVCSPLIGTALTKALLTGKYKTAEFLIQVGADVNKVPSDMSVPFSNLQIALRRQRFSLVKLIVAAGYDLVHGAPDLVWPGDTRDLNSHSPIGWLLITKFNPRRLSDICRLCIRKDLGIRVSDIVPKLYLPKCLQQFLMLEGICNEVNLREISFPETYTIVPPLLRYR